MSYDSIGVDISKTHFDAHRTHTQAQARFANTASGLRALTRWIGRMPPDCVVYEPTGPYHRRFEAALSGQLPLVKVNPLQARRFAQARGTRAKTDAVDARMLAEMGRAFALVPDQPLNETQRELSELQVARASLVRDRTALRNRLKTQILAVTRRQTKARLAQLDRQLAQLAVEIDDRIAGCPDRRRARAILISIPGIAAVTARAILIACPEIGKIGSKQLAALAGLAPMTRQSGSWRGTSFIQGGRKHLRDALFMPALVARSRNPDLAAKYDALRAAGKPHKVALTVLMRKLLLLANTLIKEDRMWNPKRP